MYNPVQYIIKHSGHDYNKKVNIIKQHFPPGVEVIDPSEIDLASINNPYFDSNTALDCLLDSSDTFKIIRFDDIYDFKIIELRVNIVGY